MVADGKSLAAVNPDAARSRFAFAIELARQQAYLPGLAAGLFRLAWLDVAEGELDRALVRASEASFVVSARKQAEWPIAYGALFVINHIHSLIGDHLTAEKGWHTLLDLTHIHSDELRGADVLSDLGRLRQDQGRLQEALNLSHNALNILERHDDSSALVALNNIAELHLMMGQADEAVLYASRTLSRLPPGSNNLSASLSAIMGKAHLKRGVLSAAEVSFQAGIDSASKSGVHRNTILDIDIGYGQLLIAKHHFSNGLAKIHNSLRNAQKWRLVTSQVDALEALTRAYQQAGDAKLAQSYAAQHAALVQKLGIERNKLQVRVTRVEPVVADLRAQWLTKLRFA